MLCKSLLLPNIFWFFVFPFEAFLGVTNGLSKMLSLGKFKPSLVISALKKSVSESRISQKYDGLGVSDFENLDLGVSDFENLDLEISPMGRSIFYPQAYPKREIKKFTPAGVCLGSMQIYACESRKMLNKFK